MRISALVKSLIILFLFALLLPFISFTVFAQTKIRSTSNSVTSTNPDVPDNLHNRTQNVMIETMLSLTCQLTGVDPTTPSRQCLGVDQKTGKIGFLPAGDSKKGQIGGGIGEMNNMISMLYTPPVRTSDYFQNLAQNFGITKKTYAYQSGFDGLKPLMNIWVAFRNMVYLIFVIVFVVIGLAIMLRIKIDPRTVMTIQNQIPKIIIGILLVTFSYAIAGFLVDMMWIFIYLIFGLISGTAGVPASIGSLSPAALQGQSPFSGVSGIGGVFGMANQVALSTRPLITNFLGISANPFATPLDIIGALTGFHIAGTGSAVPDFLVDLASLIFGLTTGAKLSEIVGTWFGLPVGTIGGAAGAMIAYGIAEAALRWVIPYGVVFVVVLLALFAALFRLWFSLLMSYLSILIDVVLAPFWIVGSLIPGSSFSVSGWFRDMIANLAVFPAVIFMFLLTKIFMQGFSASADPFVPPLIGNVNPNVLGSIIGIGMILITPNMANLVKQALKAPKMDTGAGKALGLGVATAMNTGKGIGRTFTGADEIVMTKTAGGAYEWGKRGFGKATLARLFGG
jgi:hypothetical protein